MANLPVPQPNATFGKAKCPNCKADVDVKLTSEWYLLWTQLVKLINANLP